MTKLLTDKDRELIALLRINAREPVASLARKLQVSRTTVQDRLRRLEETKVIEGYALKLTDTAAMAGLKAFITIEVDPKRTQDVVRALVKLPQLDRQKCARCFCPRAVRSIHPCPQNQNATAPRGCGPRWIFPCP